MSLWIPTDIERIATSLCLTNETDDFRRGVITLALALGVTPNNGMKLTRTVYRDEPERDIALYRSERAAYPNR